MGPRTSASSHRRSSRRALLASARSWAMAAVPWAAGGSFLWLCLRSAWPSEVTPVRLAVGPLRALRTRSTVRLHTPGGASVSVVRTGAGTSADHYVALSSRCPHLGCPVRWNGRRRQYECPCHGARFDPSGRPLAGPPLEAGSRLEPYPLLVERGQLYVLLPVEEAVRPPAPGTGSRAVAAARSGRS